MTLQEVQTSVNKQVDRDLRGKNLPAIAITGLSEEVGEVCGLVKRQLRGYPKDLERATEQHFVDELGDVLWYLTMMCCVHGTTLEEVWKFNCNKLEARYGK